MRKTILLPLLLFSLPLFAQAPSPSACNAGTVNTAYNDNVNNVAYLCVQNGSSYFWKANVGIGAPTVACSSVNYGASYTDVSSGLVYGCGQNGWGVAGQGSTSINLAQPPYYASSSIQTTTTTGTNVAGTAIAVSSCIDFTPKQGVEIDPGQSDVYAGTVVSCLSGNLIVTPATVSTYNAGTVVEHSITVALQNAVTNANGVPILIPQPPAGQWYNLNGPLQDTGTANAVIEVPSRQWVGDIPAVLPVVIMGSRATDIDSSVANAALQSWGTWIRTKITTGNLFGGYAAPVAPYNYPFTQVNLKFYDIHISGPINPGFTAINAYNIAMFVGSNLEVDDGCINWIGSELTCKSSQPPTNAAGVGVIFPGPNNEGLVSVPRIYVHGFYISYKVYEHLSAPEMWCQAMFYCLWFDDATGGSTGGDNYIGKLLAQLGSNVLFANSASYVYIGSMGLEAISGHCFAGGNLFGEVHIAKGGSVNCSSDASSPGFALLQIADLRYPAFFSTNTTMTWQNRDWVDTATAAGVTFTLPSDDPSGVIHSVTNTGTQVLTFAGGTRSSNFPATLAAGSTLSFYLNAVNKTWYPH